MRPARRILAISTGWPQPADTGGRQRLALHLNRLARHGIVDYLFLDLLSAPIDRQTKSLAALDVESVFHEHLEAYNKAVKLLRWCLGRDPLLLCAYDIQGASTRWRQRAALYHLLWAYGPVAIRLACKLDSRRVIADFPDLPHEVQAQDVASRQQDRDTPIDRMVGAIARNDIARWVRFENRLTDDVRTVTVCSERERAILGASNVFVVPNGYPAVAPVGRTTPSVPPRLLFVGVPSWPPNVTAARLLVEEIRPILLQRVPDAEILLTGTYRFLESGAPPQVRQLGYVAEIESALAMADVIVVPLTTGTGTRLKVLEAWAHRIPVVSTPKGVEGLQAESEVHCLIADDPKSFAHACERLLADSGLRARVVEGAYTLYCEHYSVARMADVMDGVIESTLAPGA